MAVKNGMAAWRQWTMVGAVVIAAFSAGMNVTGILHSTDKGIHEDPDQKAVRIGAAIKPLTDIQTHHVNLPGHPVMIERVDSLVKDLTEIKATQKQILAELRKIRR